MNWLFDCCWNQWNENQRIPKYKTSIIHYRYGIGQMSYTLCISNGNPIHPKCNSNSCTMNIGCFFSFWTVVAVSTTLIIDNDLIWILLSHDLLFIWSFTELCSWLRVEAVRNFWSSGLRSVSSILVFVPAVQKVSNGFQSSRGTSVRMARGTVCEPCLPRTISTEESRG